MFGSLNRVELIGSLGADPEIRSFQNGGRVANMRVACSESWKDKQTGERKERTEWITVAVFNDGLIGLIERFLRKGSKVYVEGAFSTRKWQDSSGNDRYSTEVVVRPFNGNVLKLDKDNQGGGGGSGGGQSRGQDSGGGSDWGRTGDQGGTSGGGGFQDDLDDDIPF
jgi:single-strand DNA-binding protein